MLRISQLLAPITNQLECVPKNLDTFKTTPKTPFGPVVIWNLIRRCNLTCKHCYSISADINFPGELTTQQIFTTMEDLREFKVPVLILSGGEPLLHPDIFTIAKHAKQLGFYTALSTNGTLINKDNINKIAEIGFDYLGISIDGVEQTHDVFRQKKGTYKKALNGIRLCKSHNIKVGLRFTQTQENEGQLQELLQLMEEEKVDKFYYSHLNYAGRGNINREDRAEFSTTRKALNLLFEVCSASLHNSENKEFVTGNNDADGVYLLLWVQQYYPQYTDLIRQKLELWGGNASGINVANIDNLGFVHPDTMWWNYTLGNIKQAKFSTIWQDTSDPLLAGLKQKPRKIYGRCAWCKYKKICDGNSRTRAFQTTGDPWWHDPGCYLTDKELGISPPCYQQQRPRPINLKIHKIKTRRN